MKNIILVLLWNFHFARIVDQGVIIVCESIELLFVLLIIIEVLLAIEQSNECSYTYTAPSRYAGFVL